MDPITWNNVATLGPRRFRCAECGSRVAQNAGFQGSQNAMILPCPSCGYPNYFRAETQQTLPAPGAQVEGLPSDLHSLYEEARRAAGARAFTASVLVLRKILMHVAVEKGAQNPRTFQECVEFLDKAGYLTPGGKGWVDYIRRRSNEANHEIVLMTEQDASGLIEFAAIMLRVIYEFPARVPKSP